MGFFKTPSYDLVFLGDIVVDDYIRLKEAEVSDRPGRGKELCLAFGGKVPYQKETLVAAAGNAGNAALCAAKLGRTVALASNLGGDAHTTDCLLTLKKGGVDSRLVQIHKKYKTNYHLVLWYGDDRTILIKHETYPYDLPDLGKPKAVYLTSLGEHSLPFHDKIAQWLETHPETKLAFQPGTYQLRFGAVALKRIFKRTDIFCCNKAEAKKLLDTRDEDIRRICERLADLGPKYVLITDGRRGAYCFYKNELWFVPVFPHPKQAVESTGAGDAFSSTLVTKLYEGRPLAEALKHAAVNAASVVRGVGPHEGLLDNSQIEALLGQAPEFKAEKII